MNTANHTILITGGATGIGLSLAQVFLEAGNRVLICGRREAKLQEAKQKFSQLEIKVCDVSVASDRRALFNWATGQFPELDILINNAGIQLQIDLQRGPEQLAAEESEIEINLKAPIELTSLFIPHLMAKPEAAIVNVTSGLAFTPLAIMPIYCASKAALHSYSMSLRHQLKQTSIKVFELIPPMVDTELDRGARAMRGETQRGITSEEVATAALAGMAKDEYEIFVGMAGNLKAQPEKMFAMMNR